jgi:hypothetical protein
VFFRSLALPARTRWSSRYDFFRISVPLTGPRHVVPENGMLIVVGSRSIEPEIETGHDVSVGDVPFAVTVKLMVVVDSVA